MGAFRRCIGGLDRLSVSVRSSLTFDGRRGKAFIADRGRFAKKEPAAEEKRFRTGKRNSTLRSKGSNPCLLP
jgi:hypothetical protein